MIRVPNWVGDAVMALPALRELRRIFANAQITFVARPWVAGLFEGEGLADNLIAVRDDKGIFQSTRNFIDEARQLRKGRFDLAVLLQNAFGAAVKARVGGAKRIAGYATDRRSALLDFVLPLEPNYKTAHQVRYYLNIAAAIEEVFTGEARVDFEGTPKLRVSNELKERGRLILEEALGKNDGETGKRDGETGRLGDAASESFASSSRHVSPSPRLPVSPSPRLPVAPSPRLPVSASPILALSPGATNSRAKRWLSERFASTADRLVEQSGFQTVIVGATGDLEVANEVASRMHSDAVVLAGRTSIADLKAILACASLVISNDTGTAHVSAALGVPTVVVFGPTEHFSTRPLSAAAAVVRHAVECSPCMLRDCPIDHRCMTRVEVDDVYSTAQGLLINAAR